MCAEKDSNEDLLSFISASFRQICLLESVKTLCGSIVQLPNIFAVNIFLQPSASNLEGPDPPFGLKIVSTAFDNF